LREMVGMTQDNISMVQGILFLEMKRVLDWFLARDGSGQGAALIAALAQ
jgi:hypothetical protein